MLATNRALTIEEVDDLVRRYLDDVKAGLESYAVEVGEVDEQETGEWPVTDCVDTTVSLLGPFFS
jgi:hypothetical protein